MVAIEQKYLQKLQEVGLFVSKPYPEGHAWEHGVIVGKPSSIAGNSIQNFQTGYNEVDMDAPTIVFHATSDAWIVLAQNFIPTFGPGDFQNIWDSPEKALDDIIDFYFGDPSRMNTKSDALKKKSLSPILARKIDL